MWSVEEIPDDAKLFYRVHDSRFNKRGALGPSVFQERGEGEEKGMSTDWNKYSTPEKTRDWKNPAANSVISLKAGPLRELKLKVIHAPILDPPNRAHTNVKGIETDVEVGLKLLDLLTWEIKSEKASNS